MVMSTRFSLLVAALTASAAATSLNFVNKCGQTIQLYHSQQASAASKVTDIAQGKTFSMAIDGPAHMFRHGASPAATLVELACDGNGVWYDVSIIPPGTGTCGSFDECKGVATAGDGYNVAVAVKPNKNIGSGTCAALTCTGYSEAACKDGYLFPKDDTKTHNCPIDTEFEVTFCPGDGSSSNDKVASDSDFVGTVAPHKDNNNGTPQPRSNETENEGSKGSTSSTETPQTSSSEPPKTNSTEAPRATTTEAPTNYLTEAPSTAPPKTPSWDGTFIVRSKYSYSGKQAGNVEGTYDQVTDLASCSKTPVTVNSPVGPMSEEVTMVFRGPMLITDIAVYTTEQANSSWSRVSAYSSDAGYVDNIVFMNNKNIDYSGKNKHGPQGCASKDGKSLAEQPAVFDGYLAEASNHEDQYGGPGIATGVEVNIMTNQPCNGDCLGYAGSNDYHGWDGGKKIFVSRVKMPQGNKPNQPAIWMLNAQVVHSNQYGCNCRGMGAVGGCGELDIAEVIETNDARDRVSTHYYFYDGSVLSPGGDNFAPRPSNDFTVYVVIINDSDQGLIKIIEIDNYDFSLETMGEDLYRKLADA